MSPPGDNLQGPMQAAIAKVHQQLQAAVKKENTEAGAPVGEIETVIEPAPKPAKKPEGAPKKVFTAKTRAKLSASLKEYHRRRKQREAYKKRMATIAAKKIAAERAEKMAALDRLAAGEADRKATQLPKLTRPGKFEKDADISRNIKSAPKQRVMPVFPWENVDRPRGLQTMGLKFPRTMHAKLKFLAMFEGVTMTEIVVRALARELDTQLPKFGWDEPNAE